MAELLLIVTLGGRRIAIDAAEVESVVEMEGLVPIPRGAPHIAGLTALRSRALEIEALAAGIAAVVSKEDPSALVSKAHELVSKAETALAQEKGV